MLPTFTPPKPLESGGVTVGELVGWRIWKITSGFLASYSAPYVWTPGQPATGKPGEHDGAGLWAFKDAAKALHKATFERLMPVAIGSVYLWGDVIEHTEGYRAEYAEVRSIEWVISDRVNLGGKFSKFFGSGWVDNVAIEDLRQRYGV